MDEYDLFKRLCAKERLPLNTIDKDMVSSLELKGLKLDYQTQPNQLVLKESLTCLSTSNVKSRLDEKITKHIDRFDVVYEINSTNEFIKSIPIKNGLSIVAAEYQNSGHGRREKKWCSPLGLNLYFSIQFSCLNYKNTQLLPLLTAVCVCKALKQNNINDCKVKWPNDIYINGKKVGGILIENRTSASGNPIYVVGIGLNVNMVDNSEIDQFWTSLKLSAHINYDRNIILSNLLSVLLPSYLKFPDFDFEQFHSDWKDFDCIAGQIVHVDEEYASYDTHVLGIESDGALSVYKEGEKHKLYSAEVSIKLSSYKE